MCRVALRFCTKHASVIEAQWPEAFSYSTAATGLGLALGYVLGGVHWSPRPEAGGLIGKKVEKVEKTGGFGGNMGKIWGTYGFFKSFLGEQMDFQNIFYGVGGKGPKSTAIFYVCIQLMFGNVSLGMQPYDTTWGQTLRHGLASHFALDETPGLCWHPLCWTHTQFLEKDSMKLEFSCIWTTLPGNQLNHVKQLRIWPVLGLPCSKSNYSN